MAGLRGLWASTGFRLAAYVGLLVSITIAATLAVVYLQTVGVMQQRMARAVALDSQRLMQRFAQDGLDALVRTLQAEQARGLDGGDELLLLLDAGRRPLAGNMQLDTAELPRADATLQRSIERRGRTVHAYLQLRHLDGGALLLVGHDMRDQDGVESLVLQACLAALGVSALLLAGGTFVFRQRLEGAVADIRETAGRIAAGQLQARIPVLGEPDEFALLGQDINRMLDRIQALMDGVRHVSDTIAHNLRTPLTRVLLRLQRTAGADADAVTLRTVLHDSATDLQELAITFEKLLRIAEAEAGTRRMPFEAVDLQAIARDVCELYDAVAEDAGQALVQTHAEAAPEPALVHGDADLLASAVANLVDNALKHSGPGARVELTVRQAGTHLQLAVCDNGPGVPAHELQRLGLRFHRLNAAVPGQGLGLASVRAIAALHGGTLQLQPGTPGLCALLDLPGHAIPA
ncbi:Signal transduction histidine kinase [Oryzisolibacter propanilivorax]|uniref:histidine kinase n=1 Tax=Oryzisolibacter propanilivorax TaxID=1527607 RepID=A0A1G9VDA3_9BURK|nr:ATP-binding protein [Oryzisolibacter propanilivorax]SDM70238.1 Signal transduction histidine kinase [Oryzisolibacter propanilivorax]